jgi:hypothetical protein
VLTFSGTHVTPEFGAPNLRDIAVSLMREVRFAGAGRLWWPVGMHSLVVADLLPKELEHHGLLHDAAESILGDISRPFKTPDAKAVERVLLRRIYNLLGIELPDAREAELIHGVDVRVACAEGRAGISGRGFLETQVGAENHDAEADAALIKYLTFDPAECLNPDGFWPMHFEQRARRAILAAQRRPDYLSHA